MSEAEPWGGAYRTIRAVRAREGAPWPGVLARGADGTRLLVDAGVLGPGWAGWGAAPDGHVLAPLDVVRRPDGHDVVLPMCTERLEDFVRRRAGRMPLTVGEAVTLGVSVVRGCAQLGVTPAVTGDWWLDEVGRPVLATDAAPTGALEAAAALLRAVAVEPPLRGAWGLALRAVSAERVSSRDLLAAEDALFAVAAPEPLSTVSLRPRSVADLAQDREPRHTDTVEEDAAPRSIWQGLLSGVDDGLADTVSRATTAVWRRLRARDRPPRKSTRRAPWLVAAVIGVAVLAGGFLWPSTGGDPGAGAATSPRTGADPTATAGFSTPPSAAPVPTSVESAAGESPGAADAPGDLAAVTSTLLDARLACNGDEGCLATVIADPATPPLGGAIELPAAMRTVTLLDDFGDLAVLRIDAADAASASQLVVILRRDEKWLLRDVHDVAQQP